MVQASVSGVGEIHLENLKRFQMPNNTYTSYTMSTSATWFLSGCLYDSQDANPNLQSPSVGLKFKRGCGRKVQTSVRLWYVSIFFSVFIFLQELWKHPFMIHAHGPLSMRWNPLCNWMKINQMPQHLIVHDLYDFTTFWARRESVIYCHHRGPHNDSRWLCNSNQQSTAQIFTVSRKSW